MLGSTIAHYKVTAKLGKGGMGEVYRATDSKLDRDVAIKILPEEFASHPERLARFEREAKALAKLKHPNIGYIHGFDQHEGKWFLVLELIEGETLAERLRTGPMPVDEVLNVFKQIAEALEAAHEKQIVHRDLKPANIKIDIQGRVKVLDFGLAKARFGASPSTDSNASTVDSAGPTITSEFTVPGKVMGTAAYMSPEQSRGQEVDRRTDAWAFGCCLYEALTGKKPFKGQTTSDLVAEILKGDPDFTIVPPETPSEVLTLLRRCLEKDTRRRLRDLGDIAITLDDVTETSRIQSSSTAQTDAVPIVREQPNEPWWRRVLAAGKVIGKVVLALGLSYIIWHSFFDPGDKEGASGMSSIRSVVVLPFNNMTGDSGMDIVAEGLSDDITSELRSINGLDRVTPWFTAKQLKDSNKSAAEIADELKVKGLIYGTVKYSGADLRVNVEILDGPANNSLWTTNLVVNTNEIAKLQGDIVLAIAKRLQIDLQQDELAKLARLKGVNLEAYKAFREGQKFLQKATEWLKQSLP